MIYYFVILWKIMIFNNFIYCRSTSFPTATNLTAASTATTGFTTTSSTTEFARLKTSTVSL